MSDLAEALRVSSANRNAMLRKFGFVPHSVLDISRGALSKRIFRYAGDGNLYAQMGNDPRHVEKLKRLAQVGHGKNSPTEKGAGRGKEGLSIMAPELVEFFIKYYAHPGDVYLDPFMGQGVQMQVAKLLGLHYYGYDLSQEFYNYIEATQKKIDDGKTTIFTRCADSRQPTDIQDALGDFCFTSPPYWDIEYYGDDPRQLGTNNTYESFLLSMQEVASAWLPKFKAGSHVVVNVNDFRKNGKFYPYHADTISLFTRAGYTLSDVWIIRGLIGGLPKAFAVDFNLKGIAPKVHEYALVFTC